MKIIIIIIIGCGLLAGVASLILDGAPQINPSPVFLLSIIFILFLVVILLISLLKLKSSSGRSRDEWGNGGGGGVDLPPLPINPYGNKRPRIRYPKNKYLTDDDIVEGEIIDERLLTKTDDREYLLPSGRKVKKLNHR